MNYERLLLDNLDLIDQVVRGISRRHRLPADDAAELRDAVRLKLIENDYDVLRRFEQRCSLRTYLTTVITRLFLDQRNAAWGKWRPSLEAKRQGPTSVLLERLLTRDGLTFDEAVETLRTNHGVEEPREALYRRSLAFPVRHRRRFVGDEALDVVSAPAGRADETIERDEHTARARALSAALAAALAELSAQDRIILKMRFQDEVQIAQIARVIGLEAKALYRRLERVMVVLRRAMEAQGIARDDIELIAGSPAAEIDPVIGEDAVEKPARRPSVR